MPGYDIFFYGASFFLLGILLASFRAGWLIIVVTLFSTAAVVGLFCWKRERKYRTMLLLIPLIFMGAFYYTSADLHLKNNELDYGREKTWTGRIAENVLPNGNSLSITLELTSGEKILALFPRYPEVAYGDIVRFRGKIEKPASASYGDYLLKEGIVGISKFPVVEAIGGKRTDYRSYLFDFRNEVSEVFSKALPQKEGTFMSGILLGGTSGFSDDFKNDMKMSGTTHLVALSGYNISVIASGAMVALSFLLPRWWSFGITSLILFLFVAMTGAEASVVRAAIMGFIMLLADESGRLYNVRNIILLAGTAMVLVNPRILIFDVGFELSFLALIGIVYLKPALVSRMKFLEKPGFGGWKDGLATTVSAQTAVLPILLTNFGYFSPISLVSNTLILGLIPFTMGLGFLTALLGLLWSQLAFIAGWLALPFLTFETFVIGFLGSFNAPLSSGVGWMFTAVYYAFLVILLWKKRSRNMRPS